MVYEQTLLTYEQGPQMVGFTLVHVYVPFFLLMLLSALLAHLFMLLVVCWLVSKLTQNQPVPTQGWLQVIVLLVCTALLYVPYGVWKYLTVSLAGPGPRAADMMTIAAADGDAYIIEAILSKGVSVDAPNWGGKTALNAACANKQVEIARFLIHKGADVTLAPECDWLDEVTGKPPRPRVEGPTVEVK